MPEFEYTSSHELQDLIGALPVLALQAGEPAMTQTVDFLHGKIPEYPEPPDGQPMLPDGASFLRTAQQKAWFFASVKSGSLPGWQWIPGDRGGQPEKSGSARTGTLGRRWTEQVTKTGEAVTGEVGTNLNYAPWVVGPSEPGEEINGRTMYQARIHVDRWWQFGNVMAENVEAGWEAFDDAFWPVFLELVKNRSGSNPASGGAK
jgi:hypothetical protein